MSLASLTVSQFLRDLGARTPAPGGGAAAALTGALAASLARMVVSYSLGRKSLSQHQNALEADAAALDRARDLFLELADEDAAAYALVNALQRLDEQSPRRIAELPAAARAAVDVPLAVAAAGADLLRRCTALAPITNPHLASDLAIAAVLARATVDTAACNVRVNLPLLGEGAERAAAHAALEAVALDADAHPFQPAGERGPLAAR